MTNFVCQKYSKDWDFWLRCGADGQGSYLRCIDSCITQLKAQGPSRTCNESEEAEAEPMGKSWWKVEEGTALLFIVKAIIALQVSDRGKPHMRERHSIMHPSHSTLHPPQHSFSTLTKVEKAGQCYRERSNAASVTQGNTSRQPQMFEHIGALAACSPCTLSCACSKFPSAGSFQHRLREI